ncbi:flagellar filament capping protein FliD [Reinekea marinisedimentorum]|uniref:Filament cap protein n=1 Tax=Reinekea marinisedimentorum TaxID=230495 RepID=A0A4R3I9N2_9GAMM|nr:flagellar filament capping protein FliD [Reinekea marinisedimentorum]TCS42102.1 flagellar hook-associated protein 2 [Reinekea marinisedimentorum]
MASVSSLGIGSGTLTTDLVNSLVSATRADADLRLASAEAEAEAEISAWSEMQSYLEDLQSAASALSNSSTIDSTTASSSDEDILTATTSSAAEPGTYRITVSEVATAHSLATKAYEGVDDVIGTGTITISFGTTTYDEDGSYLAFDQDADTSSTTLSIGSSNNTVGDIRDTINNAEIGITASVVYDGEGYRLLLTSDDTGEETSMEITVSGDAGLQALAYNSSQNDESVNMMETQAGVDAAFTVNGLSITSASNEITEVINGVTIDLLDTKESSVTLTIAQDTDELVENLESFVEAYNNYSDLYDLLTEYNEDDGDEETISENGILIGDNTLRNIDDAITSMMSQIISGLDSSVYTSLVAIGFETDQYDDYSLTFDSSAFLEAMEEDADSVLGLLSTAETTTNNQVSILLTGTDTQPGTYSVEVTQPATQGFYQGLATDALNFASDIVISDLNDDFSITLNGDTESISLVQGSYSSGDELAQMIQTSINTAFSSGTVDVEFDEENLMFSITSTDYGSDSEVVINSVDTLFASTLGITATGSGEYEGASFSSLSETAFAATTDAGVQIVDEEDSIDFNLNPVSFDLTISGTTADGTYSIALDEDWGDDIDSDGNVTNDRNRDDVLTYIQSELNDAGLAGIVTAEFNESDRLVFYTEPAAGTQTITIANSSVTGTDYLGITNSSNSSGYSVSDVSFDLSYSNRLSSVSSAASIAVPNGTYETADELAAAIETAINADANIAAGSFGASTENGSRSLYSTVDFASDPSQFVMAVNGQEVTVNVDANGTDNLDSIQTAIDSALTAAGITDTVTASLESNGLVLTTDATGSSQRISILADGLGATTQVQVASADLSTAIDFTTTPSEFTLEVGGYEIDVTVDSNSSLGDTDAESNIYAIQSALDTALALAGGGGEFTAGDVVAKLDANNQLYFETVSKNGEPSESTFGADAVIQIVDVDATDNSLGLAAEASANVNGYDAFGMDIGTYYGFDSLASVTYSENDEGEGGFTISFDNDTDISLSNLSTNATTQLGFSTTNYSGSENQTGQDVAGLINGVEASGSGQYLTASDGNSAATEGYILGGTAWDFTEALVIDSSNNTFTITVDGVESNEITITAGAYASADDFIAELESQINTDSNLYLDDISVEIQYDDTNHIFGIFSTSTGEDSSVEMTDIDDDLVSILGISESTSGVAGTESSGELDPAAGMMLKITGSTVGDYGTVTYVEGIFANLDNYIDSILGSDGLVTERQEALDEELDEVYDEMDELDDEMEAYEDVLVSQFIYYDSVIAELETWGDYITSLFESLNSSDD